MIRRAAVPLALAACVVLAAPFALRATVEAQAASVQVSGRVTSGTAGVAAPDGLIVRLIALDGSRVSTAAETATRDGRYALTAPLAAERTLVPYLAYESVDYFGDPIAPAAAGAPAQRDFLVYATTREAPALAITSTIVTLVAIDRQARQLGFTREDTVANPSDRVYVGSAEGNVTLRIPAPDGTVEAGGAGAPEAFRFERGLLAASLPIRPGPPTTVVTRYLVGYDAAANTYRLRVTAPLPSERISVRVPAGYARLRAASGAVAAPDEPAAGGDAGQALQVVRSTASTPPGGGILVDIVGLSGRLQSNALTEAGGALAGSLLALVVLGGSVLAALRWRAGTTA